MLVAAIVVKINIGMQASAAAISVVAASCQQLMNTNDEVLMGVMAMSLIVTIDFQ